MDIAGLTVGVVALWETCVRLFEVVNATREFGIDFEVLVTKLEVERVRLICWGDAVGLASVGLATAPGSSTQSAQLERPEVRDAVVRLLGCIRRVFEDSERLQQVYGLRPYTGPEMIATQAAAAQRADGTMAPSQSQVMLSGVFRRAYELLRRKADQRQRDTPMTRKSKWAVHDRAKFTALVAEIRGFNDSLESLFPGVRAMVVRAMQEDVDAAVEVRELQSLQEATAGEMDVLSERASMRLEELGVTVSARTGLLSTYPDILEEEGERKEEKGKDTTEGGVEEISTALVHAEDSTSDDHLDPMSKKLKEAELYMDHKNMGTLITHVLGASSYLSRCTAYVRWEGQNNDSIFNERDMGFVPMAHASFDMYKKKKYMGSRGRDRSSDSEDYVLLDPEAHIKFENINPGTVTVEGFGLECWDYEETRPRERTILVNRSDLPVLNSSRLLRRVNELQTDPGKFGWRREKEELDLRQFVGNMGMTYVNPEYARDSTIGDLYSLLNRTDIFADFCEVSSAGRQWAAPHSEHAIGIWNFLCQIVIAWELATRLKYPELTKDISYTGFTSRILASMIISDLWLKNVRIVLVDRELGAVEPAKSEADRVRAEKFKAQGNDALKKGELQTAVDLYTEALKLDIGNAMYRCNRAAALLALEKWEPAEDDAQIAVRLDPKYAKAWSRLGMARLKMGHAKRAKEAYERAIQVAGSETTAQMRQGLADAKAKISETIRTINAEKDAAKRHAMVSEWDEQDFEIAWKDPQFHSQVHGQQIEGLMFFAQRMRWPYINELRDYPEDVYAELRGGATVDVHLHDWLFGIILPGKWFSFKIMTALVQCTPSLEPQVGVAYYYECGLSLPTRTYWRSRTVLGRVLGCYPGVQSLCGWIGPCPAVEFDAPLENKPRFVRVKTRRVSPLDNKPDLNDRDKVYNWNNDGYDRHNATRIRPDEEIEPYLTEMKDPNQWIIPEPPVRDMSTCQLKAIRLRRLPLDTNIAAKVSRGSDDQRDVEGESEYRATLEFAFDDKPGHVVSYKLFTNPVFITPPPCRPGPKGHHEAHMRELPRYQRNIWPIDKLKDHTAEDSEEQEEAGGVMTINATGKGAELLARAWCAERGRNAVIRRAGGPCYVCSVKTAAKGGLGVGVLIWID